MSRRSDGLPGDLIGALPVNSVIQDPRRGSVREMEFIELAVAGAERFAAGSRAR